MSTCTIFDATALRIHVVDALDRAVDGLGPERVDGLLPHFTN
jgi:hypothetical protein